MSEMSLEDVVRSAGERQRRRSARAAERRKKRRRRRTGVTMVVLLLVVGVSVAGAWFGLKPVISALTEPKDWEGEGTGSAIIEIKPGSSGVLIGQELQEAGVVKTARAFVDAADKDTRAASIQPGTYALRLHMSAASALALLLQPESRKVHRVTIAEGKRASQVFDLLAESLDLPRSDFDAALKDPEGIGLPPAAKKKPEGYLFPATYDFQPKITAVEALRTMVDRTKDVLETEGLSAEEWHETLTYASLVQAEGGAVEDYPKISRVLRNRLDKGMKLELDTTVHYATGNFKITTTHAETQVKSPYNTYQVGGLPVGPICNPGQEAIDAALHPVTGPWVYFTTVNPHTGLTKFATTAAEKAEMDKELRAWQRANPGS